MKLIKQFSVLLLVSSLIITFSGCDKKEAEQDLIIELENPIVLEVASNPDDGKHANEYAPWDPNKVKVEIEKSEAKAPKTFTVKINGTKYTGNFSHSSKLEPVNYISLRYSGDGFTFNINAETKEIIAFSFSRRPKADQALDESEYRKIADNFASKYIDVSKYKVTAENYTERNECKFFYEREISGLKTAEALYVTVDGNGEVVYFFSRMLRDFDNIVTIECNENKIKDAIDAKIASIYEDIDNYEGYTVRNRFLTKLEDGSFGFLYNVDAQFEKIYFEDGSYITPSTVITLLVKGSTTKPAE